MKLTTRIFLALLLLPAALFAGNTFVQDVGNPPLVTTPQYEQWVTSRVNKALLYCIRGRATHYFVAAGGADGNNGLTTGTAFQTMSKVNTVIAAAGATADLEFSFNRGDTFRSTTGITISGHTKVAIDDYGTGDRPLLTAFTRTYASGGAVWTQVGGTDEWTAAESNDIAWCKYQGPTGSTTLLQRVTSSANVQATPQSFWWDPGGANLLHVNAGTGINPNNKNFEAVISNSVSGINIQSDGCRVDNINTEGWGCHRITTATQAEGVHVQLSGTDMALVSRSRSAFCSSHAMAYYGVSTNGIAVFVDDQAGFTKYNGGAGETEFNFFSTNGGHEVFAVNCDAFAGTLPSNDWYVAGTTIARGRGFFGHTAGGTASYLCTYYCKESNNALITPSVPCQSGTWWNNLPTAASPTATNLINVRGVVYAENYEGGFSTAGTGHVIGGDNEAVVNSTYNFKPASGSAFGAIHSGGWVINNVYNIDLGLQASAQFALSNTNGDATNTTYALWHNHFNVTNNTLGFDFEYSGWFGGGLGGTAQAINNICSNQGTGGFRIGLNDTSADGRILGNAYYNCTLTSSQGAPDDNKAVTLYDVPLLGATPLNNSPLYRKGATSIRVPRDRLGRLRPVPPSIGPVSEFQLN